MLREGRGSRTRDKGKGKRERQNKYREPSKCRFCRAKVEYVDYKDIDTLQKLTTMQGKLFSRKRSGNCAKHQRLVKTAIKRARLLALVPYVG